MILNWKLPHALFCLAVVLGGSGDCCFYAYRTGSGPFSYWNEKTPPCSPHVCWAALSGANEGVWESFSQCQEGTAVICVFISTTQKGVCVSQVPYIVFTSQDCCELLWRKIFFASPDSACHFHNANWEHVLWLPFSSSIVPRYVSSSSPVYLSSQFLRAFLHATYVCIHLQLLLISSCSFLHSEVFCFHLFPFLSVDSVYFLLAKEKLMTVGKCTVFT